MKWAQTKPRIMITIDVPDLKDPKFDVKPDHLHFQAQGPAKKYECDIALFA